MRIKKNYQRHIQKIVKLASRKLFLIYDEAQNSSALEANEEVGRLTKATIACFHSLRYKLLMSGTSINNNVVESYPQLYLLYNASVNMLGMAQILYSFSEESEDYIPHENPQLIVWKKDAVSGQLLQGAVFKATCISNGISKTAESGPDGKAVFNDLIPNQEYRVEEITPPPYFLPSTKVETVVIPDDSYESIELTWENQPYSGLTIRKVSATDGRGLKGAVFGLYQGTDVDAKKFLGEFQTDDNGRIVILIKKIDTAGKPVEGCVLQVLTIDGGFVAELKTGRNGYAVCTGVKPGWYLVKEIYVEGHIWDDTPKQVELKIGQPAVVELVNKPLNGIEIYKKTDENKPLEGVEFTVKKENSLVGTYRTAANGLIQIPDLEPGFYTIFESKGVEGYTPDARPQTVELKWGDCARLELTSPRASCRKPVGKLTLG